MRFLFGDDVQSADGPDHVTNHVERVQRAEASATAVKAAAHDARESARVYWEVRRAEEAVRRRAEPRGHS